MTQTASRCLSIRTGDYDGCHPIKRPQNRCVPCSRIVPAIVSARDMIKPPPIPPDLTLSPDCSKVMGDHKGWFGPQCFCGREPNA